MKKVLRLCLTGLAILTLLNSCKEEQLVEPEFNTESYQWETATISSTGLNDSLIHAGLSAASSTQFINSVVIVKNNKLVSTGYFNGTTANTLFDIKSVTKSFMSTFIGMAIDRGYITLDSKLTDFFPAIKANPIDPRINDITVRHLLTMTSGIKSDALIYPELSVYDWTTYLLSFRLDHDPGTYYQYSDSGAYLLSAILTKAAGLNTFEFAKFNFFNPLNFMVQGWIKTGSGVPVGGSTMMFTPKNMAVLGLLFLNKGKLNGTQIVSENWVNSATADKMNWQNEEMGPLKKLGYGYFWWTGEMNGRKVFSAIGYAGQFVFCIPDANMIVAVSSYSEVIGAKANDQATRVLNLISEYFIPAIK